jgi:hypothetical protein
MSIYPRKASQRDFHAQSTPVRFFSSRPQPLFLKNLVLMRVHSEEDLTLVISAQTKRSRDFNVIFEERFALIIWKQNEISSIVRG